MTRQYEEVNDGSVIYLQEGAQIEGKLIVKRTVHSDRFGKDQLLIEIQNATVKGTKDNDGPYELAIVFCPSVLERKISRVPVGKNVLIVELAKDGRARDFRVGVAKPEAPGAAGESIPF